MNANDIHICIGLPRSGTTWLFNNLKNNSDLFLPGIKEVGYWWGGPSAEQKELMVNAVMEDIASSELQMSWCERWRESEEPSIEGYQSLMGCVGKTVVDISPSYCIMPEERIQLVKKAIPDTSKVFAFLRNPLQRSLSAFKLHAYMHGMFRGPATIGTFSEFLNSNIQKSWSNYQDIITRWSSVFGDRFSMFYYDELEADPIQFLRNIYAHLQIDITDENLLKNAHGYFGTDRNQSTESIFPKILPTQREHLAKISLNDCDKFTFVRPEIVQKWKSDISQFVPKDKGFKSVPREIDPKYERLTRLTESLGDNCEFGFFQRYQAYEPSSLFRWAIAPTKSVIAYLKAPMELFVKENLQIVDSDLVFDSVANFHFHSDLLEIIDGVRQFVEPTAFEKIYAQEKAKIDFLVHKFFHNLRLKPAVYVVKENNGLSKKVAMELLHSLRVYNPNHYVIWVTQSETYVANKVEEGLFHATIPRFASYSSANLIEQPSWARLITDLSRHPDIAKMTEKMFR